MIPNDSILFVFEGKKTEKNYFENLSSHIDIAAALDSHIISAYAANIYQLYQEIADDEDIDLILLLKERGVLCNSIDSSSISQVYLFFDFEPHDPLASHEKIESMIDLFSNETEPGMLFISYPMIEALKYATQQSECVEEFCNFQIPINNTRSFKTLMGQLCQRAHSNISSYSIEMWRKIITNHCCKANYLVNNDMSFPLEPIPQGDIHLAITNFIHNQQDLPVLGSYPLWLLQYFGHATLKELLYESPVTEAQPDNSNT